jgi:predicted aspartyl protease
VEKMKIILSKHAQFKFQERKIETKMIEKILEDYAYLFYDLITKAMIAVGKIKIDGVETNIVIVFTKKENEFYIITAYPCKDISKEIKKKEGGRWIKIKI